MNQISPDLAKKIEEYARDHNGKVYAPLEVPELAHIPSHHGHARRDIIFPLIEPSHRTFLDIGANWGYWSRSLEAIGKDVTAVEHASSEAEYLIELHKRHGNKFKIIVGDALDMENPEYDGVLALAIFHHFVKSQKKYERFIAFLGRLKTNVIFFEAHGPDEGQMRNAYKRFSADEFAEFVSKHARLPSVQHIGTVGSRRLYRISR